MPPIVIFAKPVLISHSRAGNDGYRYEYKAYIPTTIYKTIPEWSVS